MHEVQPSSREQHVLIHLNFAAASPVVSFCDKADGGKVDMWRQILEFWVQNLRKKMKNAIGWWLHAARIFNLRPYLNYKWAPALE